MPPAAAARRRLPRPRCPGLAAAAALCFLGRGPGAEAATAPALVSAEDQLAALACAKGERYLDFTKWLPDGAMPPCVNKCDEGADVIDAAARHRGDVPSCVWPAQFPKARWRFELHEYCQESQCVWRGRWDLYRQMVSVKVAHLFGVPLSEVRSAFLHWFVQEWPPPISSPSLQKFLVSRVGEADFPSARRLAAAADPWVLLRMAFRIDTARVKNGTRATSMLYENKTDEIERWIGVSATVHNIEFEASARDTPGEHHDFMAAYQFWGFGPNEIPGEGHSLGGVLRPSVQRSCTDTCYLFNEVYNRSRCSNDCDCNGKRWCSHFGECTGEFAPCRSDGIYSTTSPTTVLTSVTRTTTKTIAGPTTTTTLHPLSLLSGTCYALAADIWRDCYIGIEVANCGGIACAVLHTIVENRDCASDLCASIHDGRADPVAYWSEQCNSTEWRAELAATRLERCATPAPTSEPVATALDLDEDGRGTVVAAGVAVSLLACASSCCAAAGLARKYRPEQFDEAVYSFYYRCLGQRLSSRGSAKRYPRGRGPGRGGAPRRASTETMKPPSSGPKWLRPKVVDVSDDEDQDGFEEVQSPRTAPGSRPTSSGNSSETNPGARHAWTEGGAAKDAGNGPGPRAAAEAAPAAKVVADTPGDKLVQELRRLRGPEFSPAERRRFFRDQLLRWHPDKNIGAEEQAAEMFKVLQDNKGWFLMED